MPSRRTSLPLPIEGGWAPALGPQAAKVTHCVKAENVYWELDGGWRKIPGAARLNSSQLTESGSPITFMALFDYWKSGTGWNPTQVRMAYAGTQIWKEDLDGVWDSLKTGLESGKQASFTQMNDLAIWSSTSTTDVPQSWNQTDATTSALAGSPPNFSFCVPHRGRLWAAGVASNPSRLYYCALDNGQDWTGAGSGSIDIDINDGDEIMGIASHKQRLWVFKGPNRGSIHYITGSAPTGSDAFARVPFVRGVPSAAHQTIVAYQNDLAWLSTRGAHSLTATEQFGDMQDGFLSWPIAKDLFTTDLAPAGMAFSQGVNHARLGVNLWTVRQSGQANNNWVLAYDYRFTPGRWSLLNAYSAASLAIIVHNSQPRLFSGGYDGYCLRHDETNRNIANSAYTAKVRLPFLHYGQPDMMKQTAWLRVGMVPHGADALTVTWTNNNETSQSSTISQATGAVLDSFLLNTDTLGGAEYQQNRLLIPGSYTVQQLEFSQATLNGDMEVHELAVQLETAGLSEA